MTYTTRGGWDEASGPVQAVADEYNNFRETCDRVLKLAETIIIISFVAIK